MGRIIPLGAIPTSNVLPDGIFRLRVVTLEETLTKEREGKSQKLMYKLTCSVVEPKEYANQFYYDNFTIGTEDDPDAEMLETWQTSMGGKGIRRFSDKIGVPFGDEVDADEFCNAVKGQEFLASVAQKVEPALIKNTNQPNPYAGRVNNNTTAYWALGEKEPALANGGGHAPAPSRRPISRAGATPRPRQPVAE